MEDPNDLVILETTRFPGIAELHADILKDAGIFAYVSGSSLSDEWAMSQKLMGLLGNAVRVSRKDLAKAREIIAHLGPQGANDAASSADAPANASPEWICPKCKTSVESTMDVCWNCLSERSASAAGDSGGSQPAEKPSLRSPGGETP